MKYINMKIDMDGNNMKKQTSRILAIAVTALFLLTALGATVNAQTLNPLRK